VEKNRHLIRLNSEKGITLVEVLATLVLISMVILLASSIHIFSQKQTQTQKSNIDQQTNVRLAANILTKEIRNAKSVTTFTGNLGKFDIKHKDDIVVTYEFKDKVLLKNNQPFITDINSLTIERLSDTKFSITIGSLNTIITIRK
jgi:type II secretory pathway component PulJ